MHDNQHAQEDDDDDVGAQFAPENRGGFRDDGPSGAMVEEARRLMDEGEDDVQANNAGAGE